MFDYTTSVLYFGEGYTCLFVGGYIIDTSFREDKGEEVEEL